MPHTNPEAETAVHDLIRSTIRRAWSESLACLIVLAVSASVLQFSETGSSRYYGCLLMLVATGFIAGVVWSFTLGYKLTEPHPVSDRRFWYSAFQTQAKLLRLVPLWYCAPICSGMLLCVAQGVPGVSGKLAIMLMAPVTIAVFAQVVWLNRRAAFRLDTISQIFTSAPPGK